MRQPISRSVIYTVIGTGLLALLASQFTGEDSQSAHVVPHPFDALNEYQPNLDPESNSNPIPTATPQSVQPYSLASQAASPQPYSKTDYASTPYASTPYASTQANAPQPIDQPIPLEDFQNENVDQLTDRLPEMAQELNPAEVTDSVDEFEDSPYVYSLSNQDDAIQGDSMEISESEISASADMAMSEDMLDLPTQPTSRFNADPSELSKIETESQPQSYSDLLPDVDTAGVRVATLGTPVEAIAETVAPEVAPTATPASVPANAGTETPLNIREARKGWTSNPFINNDTTATETSPEPTADDEVQGDVMPTSMLAPETSTFEFEDQIEIYDNGAVDVLATASTIDETATLTPTVAQPTIDHETMRSVMAPENTFNTDSPPIRVGLSQTDAQKSVHNIEYGKSLSRRGASFAARQEFYSSLRILAQSHDKVSGGKAYTEALRRGITAIKEAEDFIVLDTETQIGLNVAHVAETHSTKIFSVEAAEQMTAIEAVQRYLAYASHQLALCGGENVVSSEALYCLGKLHSVQAKLGTTRSKIDIVKAMAFHQAAVAADSTNFRSLNELGVLYANSGRFSESKDLLKRSLRIHQLPQAWQNLGVIHQRLGEQQLADLAIKEYQMVASQKPDSSIRWTPAEEFNQNAPMLNRTADKTNQQPVPEKKSLGNRILDSIR